MAIGSSGMEISTMHCNQFFNQNFIVRLALFTAIALFLAGCATEKSIRKNESNPSLQTLSLGLFELSSFDVTVNDDWIHIVYAGIESATSKTPVIRYIRSEDGGRHWSNPNDLGSALAPPTLATRGNDVQLAVSGNKLLAVWQTKGELPGMGPMASAYSHDGGNTWQTGANPAVNNAGDQAHIDLAADQQGNFHAVWLEDPEENGYQSLRYARSLDGGVHWPASLTLDDGTCSCCWNTLKVSPNGELNVLYRDMKPRDMALMRSIDQGTSWQSVSMVGDFNWQFEGCPHIGGGLTNAGDDYPEQLHALVWIGAEPKQGLYHLRSDNNGKTWTSPQPLGNHALHGDIAATDNRHIMAVWDELGPEGSSIASAQSSDGGMAWSKAQALSKSGFMATHPRIISTSAGFLALWTEKQPKQRNQLAIAVFE